MAKMNSIHGPINGIFIYGQMKNDTPYFNYMIDSGNVPHPLYSDGFIDPAKPLLCYIHFNSTKAFVDQMTFGEGTLLGSVMNVIYRTLQLK